MWQQQATFEQSNMLDVTIQCQFNIAAKNVAEFSTMFSPSTPNRQTCNEYAQDNTTFYTNGYRTPTTHRGQCDFEGYQHHYDYRSTHPTTRPGDFQMHNGDSSSKLDEICGQTPSYPVHKPESSQRNTFLDDSGYTSPTMTYTRQLSNTNGGSGSSSPLYNTCDSVSPRSCDISSYQPASYLGDQWYSPNGNYGSSQPQASQDLMLAFPVTDEDDHCEEMKIAMREKDVTHRLYILRSNNKDAADETEQYYQSQTTMIDLERHNVLCQMAFDRVSTESINKYYNKKLLTLLESVEQKLSAYELTSTSKHGKRNVTGQKKSRLLPKHAVKILESWYQENLENPYPSRDVTLSMAAEGGITVEQIRKWFANKRNRSRNSKLKKGLLEDCE